jgi:hypothetical protein
MKGQQAIAPGWPAAIQGDMSSHAHVQSPNLCIDNASAEAVQLRLWLAPAGPRERPCHCKCLRSSACDRRHLFVSFIERAKENLVLMRIKSFLTIV